MTALLGSFLQTAIKALGFLFIICGGIVCGKKFRDHRDLKKPARDAGESKS